MGDRVTPNTYCGLQVQISELVPRFKSRWVPTPAAFIEWEQSDHVWLKYFGLGAMVEDPDQAAMWMVGRTLHMHPHTWERLMERARHNALSEVDRRAIDEVEGTLVEAEKAGPDVGWPSPGSLMTLRPGDRLTELRTVVMSSPLLDPLDRRPLWTVMP